MKPNDQTRIRLSTIDSRGPGRGGYQFNFKVPEEMYRAFTMLAKERGLSHAQYARIVLNRYLKSELELVGYEGW